MDDTRDTWSQRADGAWRREIDDLHEAVREEKSNGGAPFCVTAIHDGWPAAHYEWSRTTLDVKPVNAHGRDEVQVRVCVEELKSKRLFTTLGGLTLPRAVAVKLADTLNAYLGRDTKVGAALEAYREAVDGGIESDPEPWAKADRLYQEAVRAG